MINAGRFDGKVAVVTGGFSGMGKATSQRLAREGAKVVATDYNKAAQEAADKEFKDENLDITTMIADQSSEDDWKMVIDYVEKTYGELEVLVHCAGISLRYELSEMSLEDWNRTLAINLTGPMLGMRTALPLMKKTGGAIVNVGSIAGICGHPTTAYSASKWGLRGLSKSAAFEFGDYGIRVNCVHPGITTTGIIDKEGTFYKSNISVCPQRRAGTADELAAAICFLASDDASRITGIDLNVDGGSAECGAYWSIWEMNKRLSEEAGGPINRN